MWTRGDPYSERFSLLVNLKRLPSRQNASEGVSVIGPGVPSWANVRLHLEIVENPLKVQPGPIIPYDK